MSEPGNAQLVILDVGHGNAAVVHENSATLLIDVATKSHVLEYLRAREITTIDLIVISHADQDHIGGLIGILVAGIRVKEVRLNTDSEKPSKIWRDLAISLEDARRAGELKFSIGLSISNLDVGGFERCEVEVIAPNPGLAAIGPGGMDRRGRKITSNSISACVRVLFDKKPVALLSGDIDNIALDELEESQVESCARILVFPHHGGLPGTSKPAEFAKRLLALVRPTVVLFSMGRDRHDNPRQEVIDAVKEFEPSPYIACTQLSKACAKELPPPPRPQLAAVFSAGGTTNKCCAGSVVVDLGSAEVSPILMRNHNQFVSDSVTTPLCRR